MKTKYNKNQRTLFREIKTKDDILICSKVIANETEFTMWLCQKHNLIFTRNNKEGYGYCWKCRDIEKPIDNCMIEDINGQRIINVYPIKEFHTSDIMVIRDFLESTNVESDSMKAEFAERIEDGKYSGKIINIEERTEPYEYTDFVIAYQIGKKEIELKFGCPTNLIYDEKTKKPTSKLAVLLEDFGFKVDFNKDITIDDLKKHFVGMKVSSLIANEKSKKGGTFATVKTLTPKL